MSKLARYVFLNLVLTLSMQMLFSTVASAYLGERLERVKNTDFFTWFRLTQSDSVKAAGRNTLVSFKPAGDRFRLLVTVNVTVDPNDRIQVMELHLARTFVDHRKDGIFSRDIAKSLLHSVIPKEDRAAIADLANEIEFDLKDSEATRLALGGPPVDLPATPTPGYLVFLGKQRLHKQSFSKSQLLIENTQNDNGAALRILLAPR